MCRDDQNVNFTSSKSPLTLAHLDEVRASSRTQVITLVTSFETLFRYCSLADTSVGQPKVSEIMFAVVTVTRTERRKREQANLRRKCHLDRTRILLQYAEPICCGK